MALGELIAATPWLDTHEHLVEEHLRLQQGGYEFLPTILDQTVFEERVTLPHDWRALIDPAYILSDLVCAGLPKEVAARFYTEDDGTALETWDLLEPFVAAARNTGLLRAMDLSTERMFGLRLGPETVEEIDSRLHELWVEGFYERVLRDFANVSRCQVHTIDQHLFGETRQPDLLNQDLAIAPLALGHYPAVEQASGIEVGSLDDYLQIIDWAFDRYADRAVAVKCAWAYERPLAVAVPDAAPHREFERLRAGQADLTECRRVEDFLLQRCIDLATAAGLPVKLHLGYLAGFENPRFAQVFNDVADVLTLVQANPGTTFVLMHMAWPQQEQLLAVAKQQPNVVVDLCWSWVASPLSTQDFLERALTTLPATKLLCFGGDFITVEHVVGHAEIARRGLQASLEALVAAGWLTAADAMELVPLLMHGNAERIFPTRDGGMRIDAPRAALVVGQ